MISKVKDIDRKNQKYYFFNDIIDTKNSDLNNIQIDKNIVIWYIRYVTVKDSKYVKLRQNTCQSFAPYFQ